MAKKRFGIDAATSQALSQTMQMAKEHASKLNNTVIPINKIVLDPENPRQHKIQREDLESGPSNKDFDYKVKMEEYDGLCQLSASIEKEGLLHPVTVFQDSEGYKLIAGERRLFASIIAKKTQMEARVYKSRPQEFDLKIIQWMENDSRKNLSIYKRLKNVESVLAAFRKIHSEKITAQSLASLLGISRQLAQYYLGILSNPALMKMIEEGRVTTLRVARELISYKTNEEILRVADLLAQKKVLPKKVKTKPRVKSVGRRRQKVALGETKQPVVAQTLAEGVLSIARYAKYVDQFEQTDWGNLDQATEAFKRLVKIIENEVEAAV